MGDAGRQAAALELRVAALARELIPRLADAGIPAIVLKGPALRQWLYEPSEPRASVDLDLLVAPADFRAAEIVLRRLGFDQEMSGWSTIAHGLARRDGNAIDLHRSLPGVGVEPATAWRLLDADAVSLTVAGVETRCLSVPARTLHLALHAFQHPAEARPRADLERGIARLDLSTWQQASLLAERLRAEDAFAGGLHSIEAGAALAERLGVGEPSPRAVAVAAGPANTVEWILAASGWRRRLGRAAWHALPPPAYLRSWSPLARRGAAGLVLAYLLRPFVLLGRIASAGGAIANAHLPVSRARSGRSR